MTISSVVPVNNYTGNNSTTTFDFDFLIERNTELIVTKYDSSGKTVTLTENVDYTIHEVGNTSGSYITFPIAGSTYSVLSPEEILTLSLELEIKQDTPYPQAQNFEPPVVEKSLDYITRLIQILNRKQERSIKVKESPNLDTETLVNHVEEIKANIGTLQNINNNITDILSVNSNQTNINSLAEISSDITTVSEIAQKVTTAANNSTGITTCADNITAINNAAANAQTASEKADEALASANSASSSASLAEKWAVKTDGSVDGSEYSAKYYAMKSKDHSGITYEELNSNLGYLRGNVISDSSLFSNVKNYNHSTFDVSKFTASGTPTITDNGIISGFTNAGVRLEANIDFTNMNTFSIEGKFYHSGVSNGGRNQIIFALFDTTLNTNRLLLYNQSGGSANVLWNYPASDSTMAGIQDWFSYTRNAWQTFKFDYDGTNIKLYINGTLRKTSNNVDKTWLQRSFTLLIGNSNLSSNYNQNYTGEIDLKDFSISVNGIPIFSGNKTGSDSYIINGVTVSVPYTESSTGSKIVDVAYRERVIAVYEQLGSAPYYTIDEVNQNATLPMGEVYGFLGQKQNIGDWCITQPSTTSTATKNKPSVVVANYLNNSDGYIIFSDKLCIQWGSHENSTNAIPLLVTMANTDYAVLSNRSSSGSCVTYAKTTTSITPSVNWAADWLIIGLSA